MLSKLRVRDLLGSLLGTIGVLVGLNFALARAARQLPPQQLLHRIDTTAGNARFIFLGDSQMEADADPVAFSAGCAQPNDYRPSINAGLGATKASEHCLILEHLLAHAPIADTLLYGFYDNVLTEPVPARFSELGGNRALAFIFPERAAQLLFRADNFGRYWFPVLARVPMVAERIAIWAKVERMRRSLAAIGLPPVAKNGFGRVADFAAMEPSDAAAFDETLNASARERRPFNFAAQEIMRVAAERHLKFHLIAMPVQTEHRVRFLSQKGWERYRQYLRETVEKRGGAFTDASDWVADEEFEDPLHAAPRGASIFSARLAQEICPTATPATAR